MGITTTITTKLTSVEYMGSIQKSEIVWNPCTQYPDYEVGEQKCRFKPVRFCDSDQGSKQAIRVLMQKLTPEQVDGVHLHDNVMNFIDASTQEKIQDVEDPEELKRLIMQGELSKASCCVVHQKDCSLDDAEDMNFSGPHCQPYSSIGKKNGQQDPRYRFLLIHIKHMVGSRVPVWGIENVEGFPVQAARHVLGHWQQQSQQHDVHENFT